jgi:hypothetical protein
MELIARLLELLKHSNQVAAEALSKAQCQIAYLIVMPCRSDKHSNQVAYRSRALLVIADCYAMSFRQAFQSGSI